MKIYILRMLLISAFLFSCSSKEIKNDVNNIESDVRYDDKPSHEEPTDSEQLEVSPKNELTSVASKEKKPGVKSALAASSDYKKGQFDTALVHMNKAIKENPDKPEYYHNLALIYLALNEQREAIKALRKGLDLNSRDQNIAAQLGAIFTKEKDYTKAEIALEIPIQQGTKDPKILNNYAIALTANNKSADAEKIYEAALKENPSQRDIMLNYTVFLIDHKKNYKQGLDFLNRLKFVGVQPEARNLIKDLEIRAKAGLQ